MIRGALEPVLTQYLKGRSLHRARPGIHPVVSGFSSDQLDVGDEVVTLRNFEFHVTLPHCLSTMALQLSPIFAGGGVPSVHLKPAP